MWRPVVIDRSSGGPQTTLRHVWKRKAGGRAGQPERDASNGWGTERKGTERTERVDGRQGPPPAERPLDPNESGMTGTHPGRAAR